MHEGDNHIAEKRQYIQYLVYFKMDIKTFYYH